MKRLLFALIAGLLLCGTALAQSGTTVAGGAIRIDPASNYLNWYPTGGSAWVPVGMNQFASSITSASGTIAATDTKVLSTAIMPASRLAAGTVIRVTIIGTDTSGNVGPSVLVLRFGTAGTTSDDTLAIVTFGASAGSGNGIPFKMTLDVTMRTVGATSTGYGYGTIINQGTTGISATATQVVAATMKTQNTTTASTYLTATLSSGNAGNLIHVQEAMIEFPVK